MNKLTILLLTMLLIIPIAFAKLELTDVRVYIDNERYIDANKDGGDIKVNQEDILELMVDLNNNVNTTTSVKLNGILENIDDGNDITKTLDWYDISANDDRTKTLSFLIPSDAIKDSYNLKLTINYKYSNGTEEKFDVRWDVIVQSTVASSEINLKEVVGNLSIICSNVITKMSESFAYMGKYDNCTTELSTCKEDRGTYKSQSDEFERTKNLCETDKQACQQDLKEKDDKMVQMISKSDCKTQTDDTVKIEVTKAEKSKDKTFMGIGAIAGAGALLYYWKKKKGTSVHDKVYNSKRMP